MTSPLLRWVLTKNLSKQVNLVKPLTEKVPLFEEDSEDDFAVQLENDILLDLHANSDLEESFAVQLEDQILLDIQSSTE